MKRLLAIFILTPAEQRVVICVVVLLVAGAWFKQHRDLKYEAARHPAPMPTPIIEPLPNEL